MAQLNLQQLIYTIVASVISSAIVGGILMFSTVQVVQAQMLKIDQTVNRVVEKTEHISEKQVGALSQATEIHQELRRRVEWLEKRAGK